MDTARRSRPTDPTIPDEAAARARPGPLAGWTVAVAPDPAVPAPGLRLATALRAAGALVRTTGDPHTADALAVPTPGAAGPLLARLDPDRPAPPTACADEDTARLLRAAGLRPLPPAPDLPGLVHLALTRHAPVLTVAGRRLHPRGHAVLLDEAELRPVPPAGMALLRALAVRPGHVVGRPALLLALPGSGTDEHAVESAVARLRAALGVPGLIRTVVKRGYRLAAEPDRAAGPDRAAEPDRAVGPERPGTDATFTAPSVTVRG
ncbi:winged helix-turn-helix domain-containing protein [Streptomyces sp. BI20]|uniref:winged helix-turn-helix domain-containing protein n=1 Tax=Streptomyces sp. BI20 TaxID=3403460 RepID=UPI003C774E78